MVYIPFTKLFHGPNHLDVKFKLVSARLLTFFKKKTFFLALQPSLYDT